VVKYVGKRAELMKVAAVKEEGEEEVRRAGETNQVGIVYRKEREGGREGGKQGGRAVL
jgi:hypothetical protein